MAEKTFNRKEITEILAKASELEASKMSIHLEDGITEQELIELTREAGFSSQSIHEAVLSCETPTFNHRFNWLTGTARLENILYLNTEFSPQISAAAISSFQQIENEIGLTENTPTTSSWKSQKEIRQLTVKLMADGDQIRVEYSNNWVGLKVFASVLIGMIFFLIAVIVTKEMGYPKPITLLNGLGGVIAGIASTRFFMRYFFAAQKKKMKAVVQKLRALTNPEKQPEISVEENAYATSQQMPATKNTLTYE